MPSTIVFRCPTCHAKIKAPIQMLGRIRPCPCCSARFLVRVQPPEDAGPQLVFDELKSSSAATQ